MAPRLTSTQLTALDAYIDQYADVHTLIQALTAHVDAHMDAQAPDDIHWGHVGDLNAIAAQLRTILGENS